MARSGVHGCQAATLPKGHAALNIVDFDEELLLRDVATQEFRIS